MALVQFLKKLRNEQVTVELKNGSTVWGTVEAVSPQMNVTLSRATLTLATTGPSPMVIQNINVRGNTIRQILLPESLNLDALLVDPQEVAALRRRGRVGAVASRKRATSTTTPSSKRPRPHDE
ncbi:mRNA splicing protein SMD1 KNAG_0K01890 [Huiozyma naganishii CBS 8797]|uniref:Sm domain-containing protein n=1 Tax=Huiozyma naganishii (strain ATCC MYA-139 / BCRC 22969 / CBS 8797 / KCTC 17520 / NBRC 10181 / NCYC 3082 / Yp74L-3) TaxID=1071383 RepID=J7RRS0_HUIN7|nr:hypothetical protein KNAG_0K01890 [Kazachstania naganishii CBS 8797]CCK72553.1 hypothetical protein KNAG_0K01890 [Kazachstania naganishii CBS 8797]